MNKLLTLGSLFTVFFYAQEKKKDFYSFYGSLFSNKDFIKMLDSEPYDISKIYELIDNSKDAKQEATKEQIKYLVFLITEFLDRTTVGIKKVPKYIDVKDVFENYNYYHSQDIDNIIFLLFTKYNQKYKLRKANIEKYNNEDNLLKNFIYLYPFNRFSDFKLVFDQTLYQRLYIKDNEILLFVNDSSLLENNYFKQRYCVGNKIYCFSNIKKETPKDVTIYSFIISSEGITLIEPNGLECLFSFSN